MPYDPLLAQRIDELVKGKNGFAAKKMFGGVGYLLNGNMCIGVFKDDLIVRFDPDKTEQLMVQKHVKPFDITGRAMKGWLMVEPAGVKGAGLNKWFTIAQQFVKTLPVKNK